MRLSIRNLSNPRTTRLGGMLCLILATASSGAAEPSLGTVAFKLDGVEQNFEHMQRSGTVYNPMVTTLRAEPQAGSTERFIIHISLVDLKKLTYPNDLPRDRSQQSSGPPMMDSVVMSYTNAEGAKWTGPGKVRIESFGNDGIVQGTFDGVQLPHKEKELPDIVLTDGTFRVQITGSW